MRRKPPTIASPRPVAAIAGLALVLAACNGPGGAEPSDSPAPPTSATPTDPGSPSASPTPTATAAPSPTATAASPTAEPTPAFTGGIDPPTEGPEGFSEFTIPAPDDLTEEYAAWVLTVFTKAEDRLTRMAVDAEDGQTELPEALQTALGSLYAGDQLTLEQQIIGETVASAESEEPFVSSPAIRGLETSGCSTPRKTVSSSDTWKTQARS